MNKTKYYALVFATKQDHKDGEQAYEFDCDTLNEADKAAVDEIKAGNYAVSIWERSGNTAPSVLVTTHKQSLPVTT